MGQASVRIAPGDATAPNTEQPVRDGGKTQWQTVTRQGRAKGQPRLLQTTHSHRTRTDKAESARQGCRNAEKDRLILAILDGYNSEKELQAWHDGDGSSLEQQITAIAVEIVILAESKYRDSMVRRYNWRVEQKAALEEEDRKRKLEAERAERERIERLEQARIDGLRSDAAAFQKCSTSR